MNGFIETVTWSGTQVDLEVLRHLVRRTETLDGRTRVRVSVDPRTNHPTDPGGTVTIAVTGELVEPGRDVRPHSRACGIDPHPHGSRCSTDCPTCHGSPLRA